MPFFEQTSISADATVDYMLKTFTNEDGGDRYFCLQTEVEKECMKMDDASEENLRRLERCAREFVSQKKYYNCKIEEEANGFKYILRLFESRADYPRWI